MLSIGIDIGYSTVKISLVDEEGQILCNRYRLHKGNVTGNLLELIEDVVEDYGRNSIAYGALTGKGCKKIIVGGSNQYIEEIPALVEATLHYDKGIKSIIHIGGQGSKYITGLNGEKKTQIEVGMNSNCAAGTGAFLEEQVSRMNLELEDYSVYIKQAKKIPRIAGRCSVFAKTDITHNLQEGVSVDDILLGLAYAVVRNFKGSVVQKLPINKPIMFTGGVAYNEGIIQAIRDLFKLEEEDLLVRGDPINDVSIGAALIAQKKEMVIDVEEIIRVLKEGVFDETVLISQHKPLNVFDGDDSSGKHKCEQLKKTTESLRCYLGIDVGSTSTNLVLMDEDNNILTYDYVKTYGKPIQAIEEGLDRLVESVDRKIDLLGTGITGSGRYLIGQMLKIDVIKDEITAQAKAATTLDSEVDTIFEIGGQDSKFIAVQNGSVVDFQMNKICAAGTGSFIEEQAKKFNIPINTFGQVALSSDQPVMLGERCTVFMESSIASAISKGAKLNDISSGLCYGIAQNYLNKVVGKKRIGKKVFFQGGVAYNQGVVNAFRHLVGDKITVPKFFSVTGAYGAAILACEEMDGRQSQFIGFNRAKALKLPEKRIEGDTRDSFSNNKLHELIFKNHDGQIDSNKKTVGIPRTLFTFGLFPFFNQFLKSLGFNVLLSNPTDEKTVALSQEFSMEETCFPLKLLNGHIAELIEKKVDYLMIPDLFTADHAQSKARKNYGCVYMQMAFKMIQQSMALKNVGIPLLAPTFAPTIGKEFMEATFIDIGKELDRDPEEIRVALEKGFEASSIFKNQLMKQAQDNMNRIDKNKLTFVMVSKIYGVVDPVLNLGIAKKLEVMGFNVISFTDLMVTEGMDDYENLYWPFSQHIIGAAKFIKTQPNMYAIFLSHHGCGPDSVVAHYFRKEMGDKPYLSIEVDEHYSDVGVVTRIEAFVNSLKQHSCQLEKLYIPHMYPFSDLIKEVLEGQGVLAEVLPMTTDKTLEQGRRFTVAQEYYALTALIGDVFTRVEKDKHHPQKFLVYRSEGAEADGQYSHIIKTLLQEEAVTNTSVVAPYIEDVIKMKSSTFMNLCMCFLAGDIVLMSDRHERPSYLLKVVKMIGDYKFNMLNLTEMAQEIANKNSRKAYRKNLFMTGEINMLFNDYLNNNMVKNLELENHKVIYSPMSEYMWMIWNDALRLNVGEEDVVRERLNTFANMIELIGECFGDLTPFEHNLEELPKFAQESVGYFAGANGRYRGAKICAPLKNIHGIITLNSMYENTGIALKTAQRGFERSNNHPIINLMFDGNTSDNEESKLASFIYYL